ncbi:MAG: restriction endonuclease subunit S [Candidatus Woesearchaeota archaeon]|jgi:type I restriction enzyme S subunit
MTSTITYKETEIGEIPEDWDVGILSKFIEIIGGGTPKTSVSSYWNGDIPWISVVDFVGDNRWIHDTEKKITIKGLEHSSTKLLHKGQIIVSARGTVGELGQVTKDMAFNQSCYGIDGKNNLDNDYLYYLLKEKVKELRHKGHGAVFNTITKETFNQILIPLIKLSEQQKIAKILSDLDSKMDILQQQNKTLEHIGKTIFKQWFVNFEFPNQERKLYKSSGGEMSESEIGEIPNGWKIILLKDLLKEIESGRRPKGGIDPSLKEGIPSIGAENINGLGYYDYSSTKFISEEFFEQMKQGIVKDYDILLYKDGAKLGRKSMFGKDFPFNKCAVNEHVFILRTNEKLNQPYLYFFLDQKDITENIINLNANSAQPGINKESVGNLKILVPTEEILHSFSDFSVPLLEKIFVNSLKSKWLSEVRDLLLPKLMSGKIRVPIEVP